ncbi:hypothetical protein ABAC460_04240 [Asticcacaulis sp. AC460]|uniref:hypothetical protein n=1 Tax=Asticcacaulis sp. AC460 TaxID=1282360 RepID=UPI0003C40328|nr:hypothetical protein [Asticcacaulis sp. AC460]ESQ92101.1 hypothetical protein ABAC460_04240 [Asticcacaulis sp. AC460]
MLKDKLTAMGCPLNGPATALQIASLSLRCEGKLDPTYVQIYSQFNGFRDYESHDPSFIHVWSIEEILSSELNLSEWGTYLPFADEFICADMFMFDPADALRPILKYNDRSISADSSISFWQGFVDGHYDAATR